MTIDTNQTLCFAAPLLPGTTSAEREEMLACWQGERSEEYTASRQRHGVTRESTWIQSTPIGDFSVVLIESEDLSKALLGLATSQEPFDQWFRSHVKAMHGMDLAEGMSMPELVLDHRV